MKNRYSIWFLSMSFLLFAASCKSAKETTGTASAGKTSRTSMCKEPIEWKPSSFASNPRLDNSLPEEYDVYTVDDNVLKTVLRAARDAKSAYKINLPLVKAIGCQQFEVVNSTVLTEELARKYPDIISMQGGNIDNKARDVRLDYNGHDLKAQFIWDGQVILLEPLRLENKLYYIVFDKNKTRQKKQPFEQNNTNTNSIQTIKKYYDK